jgi:histidinol dehydrogenase
VRRLSTTDPGFEAAFAALLEAPREDAARVDAAVAEIIAAVRAGGDRALLDFTARFDGHAPENAAKLRVTARRVDEAVAASPLI